MIRETKANGQELLLAGIFEGTRWCYFDTSPGGTVIEYREEVPTKRQMQFPHLTS
jgi:hypothetical protein